MVCSAGDRDPDSLTTLDSVCKARVGARGEMEGTVGEVRGGAM